MTKGEEGEISSEIPGKALATRATCLSSENLCAHSTTCTNLFENLCSARSQKHIRRRMCNATRQYWEGKPTLILYLSIPSTSGHSSKCQLGVNDKQQVSCKTNKQTLRRFWRLPKTARQNVSPREKTFEHVSESSPSKLQG